MNTSTAPVCPEFTIVRRLRHLAAESQRQAVPARRFSADLRDRLVRHADASVARSRVAGSGCYGG